jgi:hypothetical protein
MPPACAAATPEASRDMSSGTLGKGMKKRVFLTVFIGLPISLIALVGSVWAFWIVAKNPRFFYFLPIGVAGLWAIFTGLRNIWRFDTAHLDLRWHDWIGGILGFAANGLILYVAGDGLYSYFTERYWSGDFWFTILFGVYSSAVAVAAFLIVLFRFIQRHFQKN